MSLACSEKTAIKRILSWLGHASKQFTCHLFLKVSVTTQSAWNPLFFPYTYNLLVQDAGVVMILVFPRLAHSWCPFLRGFLFCHHLHFQWQLWNSFLMILKLCVFSDVVPNCSCLRPCSDAPCLLPFLWEPFHPLLHNPAFVTLCSGSSSPTLPYHKASAGRLSLGTNCKPFSGSRDLSCYTTAWWGKTVGCVGVSHSDHKQWSRLIQRQHKS